MSNPSSNGVVNVAFISRHAPTKEQNELAAEAGFKLVPVGDCNAFSPEEVKEKASGYKAVCVVHPAMAMNAIKVKGMTFILVFENGSRPQEGGAPAFFAKALHVFNRPSKVG